MEQGDTVSPEHSHAEHQLREQVKKHERLLDKLETELCVVETELDDLGRSRHQYDVLKQACQSLEELDSLGVAHLFWDGQDDGAAQAVRLGFARQKLEEFNRELTRVQDWRESVLTQIDDQNLVLDQLHYELQDAIETEEARKSEWLVEREVAAAQHHAQIMPWSRGLEEDRRFRKSLGMSLAASFAVAFLLSTIALPMVKRATVDELPERMAKLVRQERTPPPPPVQIPEPEEPEEMPEPEPVEELVEEQPPEPMPESSDKPVLAQTPEVDTKEQVKSKGILAFRDSFAERANIRPMAQLGSQARVRAAGEDTIGQPERLMVATSAPGSSGGINLSSISRDVGGGGGGIEGVALSRVATSIGGGEGPSRPLSGGAAAGRTDEEIQIVFDRYKAALYRMYNRELRKDPTLRGQLVLRLTIEPDGTVSLCQLHSSDMDAPMLTQQVVERVQTFDFGAKEDIVAVTIIYPIDFLPAA